MTPNWFIAIPVLPPAGLDQALADGPPDLRRFHPGDLHITVAFLGAIEPDCAWRAWHALDELQHGLMTISLASLKPFGRPGRPSALAFEVGEGRDALVGLIANYGNLLRAAASLLPELRAPRPHLTVARIPRKATEEQRQASLRWAGKVAAPTAAINLGRLALYTWAEDRRERQFAIAASLALT